MYIEKQCELKNKRGPDMKRISQEIKKYRIMRAETQSSLAKKVKTAATAINAYEMGSKIPKIELRCNIAEALEVDPIALSGIELDEKAEFRLLGKLLYKYCLSMKYDDKKDCVKVVLPGELEGISRMFEENEHDIEEEDFPLEELQKKEFFIETWPTYDAFYQAQLQGTDVNAGGKKSIQMKAYSKFISDFEQYKTNYLDLTENQPMKKECSRKDLFVDKDDEKYMVLKDKASELRKLRRKTDLSFEQLVSLLFQKGYQGVLTNGDVLLVLYGFRAPSETFYNDIEGILQDHIAKP